MFSRLVFPSRVYMPRRISRLLIASVLAWHAFIVLGGPCLHALPGLMHNGRSGSDGQRTDGATPLGDSADSCAICHFVAQGQLAAAVVHEPSPEGVADLPILEPRLSSDRPALNLPSPRAPPAA